MWPGLFATGSMQVAACYTHNFPEVTFSPERGATEDAPFWRFLYYISCHSTMPLSGVPQNPWSGGSLLIFSTARCHFSGALLTFQKFPFFSRKPRNMATGNMPVAAAHCLQVGCVFGKATGHFILTCSYTLIAIALYTFDKTDLFQFIINLIQNKHLIVVWNACWCWFLVYMICTFQFIKCLPYMEKNENIVK